MKFLKRIFLLYIFLMLLPFNVNAGWFGPDNYEECVLERMKGQDKAMIQIARKACEKKFPFEKVLDYNYRNNIEISWFRDDSNLYLEINENHGEYNLTRCNAAFTILSGKIDDELTDDLIDDWLNSPPGSDFPINKNAKKFTFVFSNGKTLASVPANDTKQYDGMYIIKLWGSMRK